LRGRAARIVPAHRVADSKVIKERDIRVACVYRRPRARSPHPSRRTRQSSYRRFARIEDFGRALSTPRSKSRSRNPYVRRDPAFDGVPHRSSGRWFAVPRSGCSAEPAADRYKASTNWAWRMEARAVHNEGKPLSIAHPDNAHPGRADHHRRSPKRTHAGS